MAPRVELDLQYGLPEAGLPTEREISAWVKATLTGRFDEDTALTIRIVDEEEGRELNETYRYKTGPTNVLSFPYDGEVALTPALLGDIVICAPVVAKEAREQQKVEKNHWCHMVVHGLLHLLGYDHITDDQARAMECEEVLILASLGCRNPYQ